MAEVEDLLEGVTVRLSAAEEIRAKGRRRRTRNRAVRVGAGGAALLAAAGAWMLLPPDDRGTRQTVATATANPFRTDGVIQMPRADELPGYARWHWTESAGLPTGAGRRSGPLPQVGLAEACPASFAMTDEPGQQRYSLLYTGRDHALAQYRVIAYDDTATARSQVAKVREQMTECGLRAVPPTARESEEGSRAWSGTVQDGRTMRVTVRRWNSWVSVAEVLDGTPAD
ncbi:hypothetical protein ACGFZA_03370 [Streptomyces sp. NPDC048211]|uniref:hypothetical protein n=1 Tax=Streptomyces sp. NPDC048211 TaxID=3365516 RepID=UPI000B1D65E4